MQFGRDVVTFTYLVKVGDPDAQGNYQMAEVPINAPGCRHRPLTFDEVAVAGLPVDQQWWRTTLPLFRYRGQPVLLAAVMAARGNDRIKVDDRTYEIHGGVRPHKDRASVPYKMTIISSYQEG